MANKKSDTRKAQVFDAEAFGKALKSKRTIQNNYTVRDVADIVGLNATTISRIENAKGTTELPGILVVCDWLGKSICDFIIYEVKPQFATINH